MEVKKKSGDWSEAIDDDEERRQCLLAFDDFCVDLLDAQSERVSAGQRINAPIGERPPCRFTK
jgi:hypothetical protein